MSNRNDHLSEEDIDLFRQSVGDVRPIEDDGADTRPPPPAAKARFRREDERQVIQQSMDGLPDEILENGEQLRYARPGLRDDILKRLRRGRIPIKDEVDLHGLNWREARECVGLFLNECRQQGLDCVRIIHGKGLRSGNNGPRLKTKLNSWLSKRDDVLAFCSARPDDGGTGAAYVLLRPGT